MARADAVDHGSDFPGSIFEPSQFLQGSCVAGMSRGRVLGGLFVHLQGSVALVFGQMVVGTTRGVAAGWIWIDGQQKGGGSAEDFVVLHAQIGLFEIDTQSEGFNAVVLLGPLKENGRQSHGRLRFSCYS